MCLRLCRGQDSLDFWGFAFFPKEKRFHQVEALELNPSMDTGRELQKCKAKPRTMGKKTAGWVGELGESSGGPVLHPQAWGAEGEFKLGADLIRSGLEKRTADIHVHSRIIHNSQEMGTTKVSADE